MSREENDGTETGKSTEDRGVRSLSGVRKEPTAKASSVVLFVPGVAVAQGSMTHVGRGRMRHSNRHLLPWREHVARCVANHVTRFDAVPYESLPWWGKAAPVQLRLAFFLPRGKTVTRADHTVSPDLDKLARAIGDALEGVLYANDSQVFRLIAQKQYARDESEQGVLIHATMIV